MNNADILTKSIYENKLSNRFFFKSTTALNVRAVSVQPFIRTVAGSFEPWFQPGIACRGLAHSTGDRCPHMDSRTAHYEHSINEVTRIYEKEQNVPLKAMLYCACRHADHPISFQTTVNELRFIFVFCHLKSSVSFLCHTELLLLLGVVSLDG